MEAADLGPTVNIWGWTLAAIAGVFLALRCYCKVLMHRALWIDDWFLVASWLAILGSQTIVTFNTTIGMGKHSWLVPKGNLPTIARNQDIIVSLSILALIWSKVSFSVSLLRLTSGYTRAFVWFAIVTTHIFLGVNVVLFWVQCTPIAKTWQPELAGTCWSMQIIVWYSIFSGAWSAVMDFSLALLPWKILRHLPMEKREKIGVAVAMSLGIL